jgi:hypothetical protein
MTMRWELWQHRRAYSILIVGLVGAIAIFMATWPNMWAMRLVAVVTALFYAVWGITTHIKTSHLTQRVILEYCGIAVLGAVLLIGVTL